MNGYRLSSLAKSDIAGILDYTVDTWGEAQAHLYLDALADCFARLAQMPELGRKCDLLYPGLRRMEQGKHVIFYKHEERSIFVSRILHRSMMPNDHELLDT